MRTNGQADQEIWPGEGVFFGLSTVIKFPANYSESPFSVIGSGVTCLPQRVSGPALAAVVRHSFSPVYSCVLLFVVSLSCTYHAVLFFVCFSLSALACGISSVGGGREERAARWRSARRVQSLCLLLVFGFSSPGLSCGMFSAGDRPRLPYLACHYQSWPRPSCCFWCCCMVLTEFVLYGYIALFSRLLREHQTTLLSALFSQARLG